MVKFLTRLIILFAALLSFQVHADSIAEVAELFKGKVTAAPSVKTNSESIPLWYLNMVKTKVERYWNPSSTDTTLKVVMSFTILRDGKIVNLKLKSGSGKQILDRQALYAVESAAPFSRLPSFYKDGTLDITYTLIPVGEE